MKILLRKNEKPEKTKKAKLKKQQLANERGKQQSIKNNFLIEKTGFLR